MKTETLKNVKVETVLGTKLETPIIADVTYEAYESLDEIRSAGDWPSDKEILEFRNRQRAQNARQKFVAEQTKELADKIRESDEFKLDELVKTIRKNNKNLSEEKARALAESMRAMAE